MQGKFGSSSSTGGRVRKHSVRCLEQLLFIGLNFLAHGSDLLVYDLLASILPQQFLPFRQQISKASASGLLAGAEAVNDVPYLGGRFPNVLLLSGAAVENKYRPASFFHERVKR